MNDGRRFLPVPDALIGERVDSAVARMLGLSRTKVADMCDAGLVRGDGEILTRSAKLRPGMMLELQMPAPRVYQDFVVAGMRIIHDDADLVVVDKPAGVAAHFSNGWSGPTVVGSLRASGFGITGLGPPEREGIVHRLDVGTSGIMVVAKSDRAYSALKRAFKNREVTKKYLALAQGRVEPATGLIDAPIAHYGGPGWKMAIRPTGKPAQTRYRVHTRYESATLLDVELLTGRTHQIRVHAASIGHPLVGDGIYGADAELTAAVGLERQWLHAHELTLLHPGTGREVTYRSDPADDLARALARLGPPLY